MNAQPMSYGFGFWLNWLFAYMGGNLLTVQSLTHTHSNDDFFHGSDKMPKQKVWILSKSAGTHPPPHITTKSRIFPTDPLDGSSYLNIAKDCLLTGQEQACTRISRFFVHLFVCSSPCQSWPNTQNSHHIHRWYSCPDQERGILLQRCHWVLFHHRIACVIRCKS